MHQHIEVLPAVVVEVHPHGTAGFDIRQGCLPVERRPLKGAVAPIAEQGVGRLVAGDIEIRPAVVVEVAPGLAHGHVTGVEGGFLALFAELVPGGRMFGVDAGPRRDIQEQGDLVGRPAGRGRCGLPRRNDGCAGDKQHGCQEWKQATQVGDT